MNNIRCEITVTSCSYLQDRSTICDMVTPLSDQCFVETFAMQDACQYQTNEWYLPVVFRFEDFDYLVEADDSETRIQMEKCPGDALKLIETRLANGINREQLLCFSRIESAGTCAGESYVSIKSNKEQTSLTLLLEDHCIHISLCF